MTKTRSTKRALFLSAMSLLLCAAMLIGTTYAWFTESVSSVNNVITGGNLDVELWYKTVDPTDPTKTTEWAEVDEQTNVFTDALWEPGHTQVVYLKVVNKGTLSLKYQLGVNVASELAGINEKGEIFRLSDYIEYSVMDGEKTGDRAALRAEAAKAEAMKLREGYSKSNKLFPAGTTGQVSEEIVTMVVYMPETVGNEANHKTGTVAPTLTLGINLIASQYTWENDSFGSDYDKTAPWTGGVDISWYNTTDKSFTLTTAEQLAGLAQIVNAGTDTFKGKTVVLGANIDLNNAAWTPIGTKSADGEKAFTRTFAGTFDGAGYTVSNLYVSGGNALGLFGRVGTGAHIEDLTIDGAYVSGTDYVGAIAGYAYLAANCIKNCVVTDAEIIATPILLATGEFDGGAKAGVIVGYALNGNLIGNTAKNSSVIAYRDLGGIAGMLNDDGIGERKLIAEGNTVSGVTLSYVGVMGTYADGKSNVNMDNVVGRLGAKSSVGVNTVENVTKNTSGAIVLYTADDLYAFARSVNGGNTYAGKTVLLGADIDLENKNWTPIGNSTTSFQGTFDGNNKTISNLNVNMPGKSNAGLFGVTTNGEVKNLTVENATVTGRLNVGVVAGTPYTSKYTNITVKGHVEVNGMAYVGGVGGKNAYANWTNITVNVDETSYVKADSVENGTAYRTYVGGVVGFNGEGGHTFKNITSNIDVIGSTIDVGGAFGIAHYGNNFENVTVTGNVTITNATEAADAEEMGGIAGVWNNGGSDVTFTNCKFTGTLTANVTEGVDLSDNTIAGSAYSASGTGKLMIDGKQRMAPGAFYDETNKTYEIYSSAGLTWVSATVNATTPYTPTIFDEATVFLMNDIDLGGAEWIPIGDDRSQRTEWHGVFDGQGYTISNFKITKKTDRVDDNKSSYGLFGNVKGTVKNLTVSNVSISGAPKFIGVLVGRLNGGLIENCHVVDSKVTCNNWTIGGLVGQFNDGKISGCSVTNTTVEGYAAVGGIVGIALNTGDRVIEDCTVEKCAIVKNGSFGGDYDKMFGAILGAAYGELVVDLKNCKVENTTIKGEASTVLYGFASEDDVVLVNGFAPVETADDLQAALSAGHDVILSKDVETEAATTAPYGNKVGLVQDGGVIDGNGKTLSVECYGDDYGIMTSGGTIKNITIKEGCRAIMIMYPTADIIIDNANIGGDGVLYPINTGEEGAAGVNLIVTNSTLAGWTSYGNIESASFTNVEFKQGTYYDNIYGRVLKPYVNTTLTDCSFVEHMNLDLSSLAQGQKVTITNCTVNGVKVDASVFTVPSTDAEYDTELFTVDLPSWATGINDCIVFG